MNLTHCVFNRKLKAHGVSSNITAIIRELPDIKSSEKKSRQFLEIWKNGFLFNSVELQLLEKHGKVYTDGILLTFKILYGSFHANQYFSGTFGCLSFSPDEKHLVYLAEKKESKKQSFLQFGLTTPTEGTNVVCIYFFIHLDTAEKLRDKLTCTLITRGQNMII